MSNNLFMVIGDGPTGWKVTGRDNDFVLYVQGGREKAEWVASALNTAYRLELEAVERGG